MFNRQTMLTSMKILTIIFFIFFGTNSYADVYINVMAVNPTENPKETNISFNLPGDLTSTDVLDTNGLDLEYNVNDFNYYVFGKVNLNPKESKTFRVRVKDIWKLTPNQIEEIKKEIDQGYEQLGKQKDIEDAKALKENLINKLDMLQDKSAKADSVEKRIDSFRIYHNELKRIENSALAVDYWRSDPAEVKLEKIVRFNIEVKNTIDQVKNFKNKQYLPTEVKPEDLVEFEGFEVRYDQVKKTTFLFKEESLQPSEIKKYTIGLRDIWFVPLKDTDYLKSRANIANDFLKESKYAPTSKLLYDEVIRLLKSIEDLQALKKNTITEHISVYRDNKITFDKARDQVENLEKLLSAYREDLEKSKVKNVLQKMQSLKGVSDVSKAVFEKTKVSENDSWKIIFWVLVFVGFITIVGFIVWVIRSNDKKIIENSNQAAKENSEKKN